MAQRRSGPSERAAAARRGTPPRDPPAAMPAPRVRGAPPRGPDGRPEYTVYRSRAGPLSRLRLGDRLRLPRRKGGPPRERRRLTVGRAVKLLLVLAAGWIALSGILFFVSAQTTPGVPDRAERALSGEGSLLTGSTILVLGSDERPQRIKEQLEARGQDPGEGGRADSILLLHVSFGSVRRLSILRDSLAAIPGHEPQRINAAYFLGGPPLMIQTVEQFLGNDLRIDHLIEVNFARFPGLIDALGGVNVTAENDICSPGFDQAGEGVHLEQGEHHLGGVEALAFARVRTNPCAPGEDDRARAARQQEVFSAIRSRALSPWGFIRLPWASWHAPRAIRTDLRGPGLSALFADLLTGGSGETEVLEASGENPDGSLVVTEDARAQAVDELLGRD